MVLQNHDGTKHPWVKGRDLRLFSGEPYFSQKGDNQSLIFFFYLLTKLAGIIIDCLSFYIASNCVQWANGSLVHCYKVIYFKHFINKSHSLMCYREVSCSRIV